MSFLQRVFSNIKQNIKFLPALKTTNLWIPQNQTNNFHSLTQPHVHANFLTPTISTVIQSAGFKVKVRLRRRCKDCFFVRRFDRLHVICKTHRRHKQMQMKKDERNTWILSHATQGKVRLW